MINYLIRIDTNKITEVSNITGIKPTDVKYGWEIESNENQESFLSFLEKISKISKILEKHYSVLEITKNDITLWYYYEYGNQCNMEFDKTEIELIQKLGITLCISCWSSE